MPITKSAKKAVRGSKNKRDFNLSRKDAMKSAVKTVKKLTVDKNIPEAKKTLAEAYKAIDKACKTGVIKKNAAARKKARLSAFIKKSM